MLSKVTSAAANEQPFHEFIWKKKENKQLFFWASSLSIILFVLFKILYPFPDFFIDSKSYIIAAGKRLDFSIWPIGYSKFLLAFHCITRSALALVCFQYFLVQSAALYLYFTILYFFNLTGFYKRILYFFFLANPLTLYLSNTIGSDALFGALSLYWITMLIWITLKPGIYQIVAQAVILALCFTIRQTAYYYPLAASLAFILSKQKLWRKAIGIILPLLLIVSFVSFTQKAAYKLTGISLYSSFSGWQIANNALYIYNHVQIDSTILPIGDARLVNRLAIKFYELPASFRDSFFSIADGNVFITHPYSPLSYYFRLSLKEQTDSGVIKAWAQCSETFTSFGRPILLEHPLAYFRYFVFPNCINYFFPPISTLGHYNIDNPYIEEVEREWFNYKTNKIKCVSFTFQSTLVIFSMLFLLLNIYFLEELISLFIRYKSIRLQSARFYCCYILIFYLLLNFLFSTCTTINILRYQYVPMFILLTTSLLISQSLSTDGKINPLIA